MKKTILLLGCLICVHLSMAQEKESSDTTLLPSDSLLTDEPLLLNDSLLHDLKALIDSLDVRSSFFTLSVGAGNRLFSLRNNNVNALQGSAAKFNLTPTAAYYHKSGLGLMATAYMSIDSAGARFYQYAISPSYDYLNSKHVAWGIAYARYFTRDDLNFYASPFQNEVFAYINARKGWLRPGFSAGWAKGSYKEVYKFDTTIRNLQGVLVPVQIRDTTKVTLRDFSLVATVMHNFEWDHIFSKKDNFTVTPQLLLVAGGQQYNADTKGRYIFTQRPRLYTDRLRYDYSTAENTGLRFQSVALSLSATYFIGRFSLSPQYFLSYYIPESSTKVSQIFSVMASFTF
ncbi:MAG: hypothetical protein SFU87_02530 [Chitinophagaceae bacterium]|nr:hypothetical protein [Chitinophagaceae bacterium]